MGLSLVRSALKKSALGEILEPATQEQLISAIENKVQHALAPDGALSTSIRVQMTNVLQQSNKTVREIFMGSDEAGYSATADGPRGSTQHAGRRPPPMDGMSPGDLDKYRTVLPHPGQIPYNFGEFRKV